MLTPKSRKKQKPKKVRVSVRYETEWLKEITDFLDAEYRRTGVRISLNSFIVQNTLAVARGKQIDLL